MGAANPLRARRRTPLRRATLLRALEVYRQRFGLPDGRVPATFEIVTLTGWAPHASQPQPLSPAPQRCDWRTRWEPPSNPPATPQSRILAAAEAPCRRPQSRSRSMAFNGSSAGGIA